MKKIVPLLCVALAVMACNAPKQEGVSVVIPQDCTQEELIKLTTLVRPSYRQLDYQEREALGFIHFGMNTFTEREWGTGNEDPALFNPSQLDADQWIKTFKEAGITAVIFVAKHHDGFCLWPSKTTDHTVAHSPWKNGQGDVLREVSDACRKYDVKLCVYVSPWDMHESTYGTEAYNQVYINQVSEVLTHYGDVYLLWFDGAGLDKATSGVDMPFDWQAVFGTIRRLQPDVLLSGSAPDIRWVGNEAGKGHETEWCVQGIDDPNILFGGNNIGFAAKTKDLGSIAQLAGKKRLVWYPGRGGLPLRKGWFYNAKDNDNIKSVEYLTSSYFSTIGQNSNLLYNLSPDKTGRFPQKDSLQLLTARKLIMDMKKQDFAANAVAQPLSTWKASDPQALTDGDPYTSWHTADGVTRGSVEIQLPITQKFNVVKLQENIRDYGQRVEHFAVDAFLNGAWEQIGESTTIGFRKMLRLDRTIATDRLRIRILDARVSISLGNVSLYYLAPVVEVSQGAGHNARPATQGWTLSTENVTTASPAVLAALIDHDPKTVFEGTVTSTPAALVLDMAQQRQITGLIYRPSETDGSGHLEWVSLYVSVDGRQWQCVVKDHRFGNIVNNPIVQNIPIPEQTARYIKIEILKTTAPVVHIEDVAVESVAYTTSNDSDL